MSCKSFLIAGYKPLVNYRIWKYFLLFCGFYFYFLHIIICIKKLLIYLIYFLKYILLIMLLQLSPFFLPFIPPLPCNHLPSSIPLPLSSCPWVIHISSLASPFPILFLTSPCLFCTYKLCFLFPVSFTSFTPLSLPMWSLFLWIFSCSSCLLSLFLVLVF